MNVTEEKTVVYTFAVTLYPEVTLGQYKGLSAPKESDAVTDEEVDEEVENVRKRNARKVSVDDREAQMGDTVNIEKKMSRLRTLLERLSGTEELAGLKTMDLRYKNQIVCTKQ